MWSIVEKLRAARSISRLFSRVVSLVVPRFQIYCGERHISHVLWGTIKAILQAPDLIRRSSEVEMQIEILSKLIRQDFTFAWKTEAFLFNAPHALIYISFCYESSQVLGFYNFYEVSIVVFYFDGVVDVDDNVFSFGGIDVYSEFTVHFYIFV